MIILNKEFSFQGVSRVLTVPDCNVLGPNKLGTGNGEAKFYFGSKSELNSFALGCSTVNCFFLKNDLQTYLLSAQKEYMNPTQDYAGREHMADLWRERMDEVSRLPDIIEFKAEVQSQIAGPRGYLNSGDYAYKLFRKLSLPLISYISIMRLVDAFGKNVYYWKLFVDFDALRQKGSLPQVLTYGKKKELTNEKAIKDTSCVHDEKDNRSDVFAQTRFRERLLGECPFCPITMISDERLLIETHIKPLAVSEKSEAFDSKNGFVFSPLYNKLFEQGFISFTSKKNMIVSNWLSPSNQKNCRLENGLFIQFLPLDEKRERYLQYHRKYVFKG